tara:strand:- start:1943 stop:2215 length:273 start_codon:yes stop_codon:yes gene_type:complete
MIDKLNEILKGIDQDCCNGKDGWWETSCGAEFGAKKLKEVQDLVKKLTLTDVSQQRKLLIADFIEKYNKGLVGNERIHEDCLKDYLQGNL